MLEVITDKEQPRATQQSLLSQSFHKELLATFTGVPFLDEITMTLVSCR
jgi:hypothetical protein